MRIKKNEYRKLPTIRKYRRLMRRAGKWLERVSAIKGVTTNISLKQKDANIIKTKRYKGRILFPCKEVQPKDLIAAVGLAARFKTDNLERKDGKEKV